MPNSRITLTFNSKPDVGTIISFGASLPGSPALQMTHEFLNSRSGLGESAISSISGDNGIIATANNYRDAFNIDYNIIGNFIVYDIVAVAPSVLVIETTNPAFEFVLSENTTNGAITVLVENNTSTPLEIDSVTGSEASADPCDNIRLSVDTNVQADNITSPISQPVASNPFIFEVARAESIQITMDENGNNASVTVRAPRLLESYFNVTTSSTGSSGNLTVQPIGAMSLGSAGGQLMLNLEFSLNNVDWLPPSSFSNLPVGDGTLYIRDNRGCQIEIAYTIPSFSPNLVDFDPVCEISNLNAIRFKEVVDWNSCSTPKNKYNTLSYEEDTKINQRGFVQRFQTCDTVPTQVKSNYENHTVTVTDADGNETNIPINAATSNMNNTDMRDGTVLIDSNNANRVLIYFGAGNTYDPDTMLANGTYNLGQNVPDWLNAGDYVNIQGYGWVLVSDVLPPNEFFNYYRLMLNLFLTDLSDNDNVIVTSVYNIADFERHEFSIDWNSLGPGCYQVKVEATDSNDGFDDKTFLSEWIHIKEQWPNHHLVKYYNSEINEINWATGIVMFLRLPWILPMTYSTDNEEDVVVLDTKTVNLENWNRNKHELSIRPVPTMMVNKLDLMVSQDHIQVDGINYVKQGEPTQRRVGVTNLYEFKATLVESEYIFKSNSGLRLNEIILPDNNPIQVDDNAPGLLFAN